MREMKERGSEEQEKDEEGIKRHNGVRGKKKIEEREGVKKWR